MLDKESYPLYRYCLFSNIHQHKGQLISIVGKVTSIDLQSQTLTLQADPVNNRSIKVIVPEFQINYLFDQNALNTIVDKEDLELAERFINNKQKVNTGTSLQVASKEDNNYTSLMWFAVSENDPQPSKKAQAELEQKRNGISAASLIKTITVSEFNVNQYLQVRGKCINEQTVEMQEFTDFQQNFDLQSHNYSLALGLQYCDKIL